MLKFFKSGLITLMFGSLLGFSGLSHAGGNLSFNIGFGHGGGYNNHYGHGYKYGYGYKKRHYFGNNFRHNYGHNYGHSYGNGYGSRYGHKYYNRHYRRHYQPYHHNRRGYGHYNSRINFGYGGHGYHNNSSHVAGALIIGSIIGYGISKIYNHHHYQKKHYNQPKYYPNSYPVNYSSSYPSNRRVSYTIYNNGRVVPTAPVRRLHKDRNGNCFEINRNSYGDEFQTQLNPYQCNW